MSRSNRRSRSASPRRLTYVVVGSAWSAALLVGTGWALVGTLPIVILGAAVVIGRPRWRLVIPFAAALALSQAIAIALWATRETPPPSLTKDYDPVHVGITVALAVAAALAAHYTVWRDRRHAAAARLAG